MFRGNPTREPDSVVYNDEQGDVFYSADPHRNRCSPQLTQEKLWRGFGKNEGAWTGKVEISSRKKSLVVGEACCDLLQALRAKSLNSPF